MFRQVVGALAASLLMPGGRPLPAVPAAPVAEVVVTSSPNTAVRVVAPAAAGLRAATAGVEARGDTLVGRTPLRFRAGLADADVRVEAAGGVAIRVHATLTGAPARELGAGGRAVVLRAGGAEIAVAR